MKLINVEHKETEYTFTFTEKELKILIAAIGISSPNSVIQELNTDYIRSHIDTSDVTTDDVRGMHGMYRIFGAALGAVL